MMLTVRGLVLRVVPFRDYDKLVTVLTEDRGKLFFSANAVRSIVNPNSAACNPFTFSEFVLREKQDRYYLSKAQVLKQPLGYNCGVKALAVASYFAELCEDVGRDEEGARICLYLLMNALSLLKKEDRPVELIKAIFELRLISALGFLPQLDACGVCGKVLEENRAHFHFAEGTVFCADCAANTDAIFVSDSCLALAKRSISAKENEAYAVKATDKLLNEFSVFCEKYLLAQLQRGFSTLDFYHKIEDPQ